MMDRGGKESATMILIGSSVEKGGVVSGRVAAWQVQVQVD